jgi:hypothetical protein
MGSSKRLELSRGLESACNPKQVSELPEGNFVSRWYVRGVWETLVCICLRSGKSRAGMLWGGALEDGAGLFILRNCEIETEEGDTGRVKALA